MDRSERVPHHTHQGRDRLWETCHVLLSDLRRQYGQEGLHALQVMHQCPQDATPWQRATALHIREALGPDIFWLSSALALETESSSEVFRGTKGDS